MAEAIVHRPGEGEALFGGRIVLKSALPELTVTESFFPTARPGASPHLHRTHADAFYVLEGRLGFVVGDVEHELGPGDVVLAPPGVVHGFRSLTPARFLNIHAPDGRFAEALRERDRGGEGAFDSVDAEPGTGRPASDATLLSAGAGVVRATSLGTATAKVSVPELTLVELDLVSERRATPVAVSSSSTEAFYVLGGAVTLDVGGRQVRAGAGSFVVVPAGVRRALAGGPARVLALHAGASFGARPDARSARPATV